MDVLALSLIPALDTAINILTVAIGLGLVIFFHELGHFAVAKWCDVNVERFSIGFGPILLRKKWGETEYALSAIPFGGYVKMLGQDDMDPSQQTSEDVAEDPRSYSAKSVPQRMAIISAGVIMNVVTGLLFFALAFQMGVETAPNVIGHVQVGMPAWEHGIRPGDVITEINGNEINDFTDLMVNVALSSGPLEIRGRRAGERFSAVIEPQSPDEDTTRRQIGVGRAQSLELIGLSEDAERAFVTPGTPAARIASQLRPGDRVVRVGDAAVSDHAELAGILAARRGEELELQIERRTDKGRSTPETVTVSLPPQPFRVLGLQMDIGRISAIREDGPGARAGLRIGDKITAVNGQNVGSELDPLHLPDRIGELHGQEVTLSISREVEGREPEARDVTVVPEPRPGWSEPPTDVGVPLAIPALGVAYHLTPTVLAVEEGAPAADSDIRAGESVVSIEFELQTDVPKDVYESSSEQIEIGEDNWAFAFWRMQQLPISHVTLKVQAADSSETRTVALKPALAENWYVPGDRGLRFSGQTMELKADSVAESIALGWRHTVNTMANIYLTLRGLLTGDVSYKEIQGPINIAKIAYASSLMGLASFLLFLGLISVNLAVINFLPIPVLDGGHMVFLIWEAIIRRKPSERIVAAATYCGLLFVLGLMLLVIYLDLFVSRS